MNQPAPLASTRASAPLHGRVRLAGFRETGAVPGARTGPGGAQDAPSFYRPELDGLRLAAFLLVFLHHAFARDALTYAIHLGAAAGMACSAIVNALGCGLPLFFALSGYLITELLAREQAATGGIDVKRFWFRRILRIWPLYGVALLLGVAVALVALRWHWPGFFGDRRMLAMYATFIGNFYVAGLSRWPENPMTLLWSLSIEEQFYLVWPLVMCLGGGRLARVAWPLMVLLCLGRAWSLGDRGAISDIAIWSDTIVQAGMLAVGAGLSLVLAGRLPAWGAGTRLALAAAAALLWMEAMLVFGLKGDEPAVSGPGLALGYGCVALGCVAALLSILGIRRDIPGTIIRLGRISFGLYVFHGLAILLVEHGAMGLAGGPLPLTTLVPLKLAIALPLTIAMAAASAVWLERPFLRWKRSLETVRSSPP